MTKPTLPYPFPQAIYDVEVETDRVVTMRDGVRLATDIYRPDRPGPLPTILIRTQYGKAEFQGTDGNRKSQAYQFAGQGFAVVVQDLRGLFNSEGAYQLAQHDGQDGFDTLSWIDDQTWSNGRVGTLGCSSLGITQVLLAQMCHPVHACAVAQASGGANGGAGGKHTYWDVWRGGAVEFGWALEWFAESGNKDRSAPGAPDPSLVTSVLHSLPVIDMAQRLGVPNTDWEDWVSHPPGDAWWDQFGFLRDDSTIDVPTLLVNSWYDIGAADAVTQLGVFSRNAKSELARKHQHLVLSPALHCGSEKLRSPTTIGERELGDASLDLYGLYLDWFRHFLEDVPAKRVEELPRVQYFTMGENQWKSADSWPPPGVRSEPWYLSSTRGALTRDGDGRVSPHPPTHTQAESFVYDPADPMPSLGGGSGGPSTALGPRDHTPYEGRPDILVFSSRPLDQPIEVTGTVLAVLFVSCSTPDTDLVVKLLDVYPDGRAYDLVDGILRLRFREGFSQEVFMEPGEVYRVEMELDATSNLFQPGHQIRVHVTGSNFPRYDRNLNTGGSNYDETTWQSSELTIHCSPDHPSHVLLPVCRNG